MYFDIPFTDKLCRCIDRAEFASCASHCNIVIFIIDWYLIFRLLCDLVRESVQRHFLRNCHVDTRMLFRFSPPDVRLQFSGISEIVQSHYIIKILIWIAGLYILCYKILKSIVKYLRWFQVRLICTVDTEHNAYKTLSAFFSIRYKRIQTLGCISRLSCCTPLFIVGLAFLHHFMMVKKRPFFIRKICLRNRIFSRCCYLTKERVFIRRLRDQSHIIRTCVMIIIIQAMRIRKMCIHTSQFGRLRIHHVCKTA